jgi:hypothetical protein
MWPEIWGIALLVLAPVAFYAGRVHRRVHGPATMKTQVKRLLVMFVVLTLTLLAVAAFADTRKPPPIASAARSGAWRYSTKEIALPSGPLCAAHARILGRHVTLKVAGAQRFETTVAIVKPQHKRGNTLSIYVDNEEVHSVHLQYGQEVQALRIPLPPGAQTLTLSESKPFPKITFCNPTLL